MHRRRFIVLCGSLAGAGLIGCANGRKFRTLRVSANPHFSMSPLYLAQELGYFAAAGLKVEVKQVPNSSQAIALAAGESLDIVFSSASAAMVNAVAKGARLKIVAGREIAAPDCSDVVTLYGRRSVFPGGIQDLRQLTGKRVAANLDASLSGFCVDTILAREGITVQELGILKMRGSESIPALLAGRIDAVFVSDFSRRYRQVADAIFRGVGLSEVLPNHQYSYILFGSTLLDGDPDAGGEFLSAYLRGSREFLNGRTPKFHDELARSNGIDPIAARKACRNTFVPDGRIDFSSLDRFIHWAAIKGHCLEPVPAEQLTDMRFLEMQGQ